MTKYELLKVIRRPLITEKANEQKESLQKYLFEVSMDANKVSIGRAVEAAFGVKVTTVRTAIVRGDVKRVGRFAGRRPNWEKATVTLAAGHVIDFFEEV